VKKRSRVTLGNRTNPLFFAFTEERLGLWGRREGDVGEEILLHTLTRESSRKEKKEGSRS